MYKDGKISLDDGELIEKTAKKLNVDKCYISSCIENQRNLEVEQIRRAQ